MNASDIIMMAGVCCRPSKSIAVWAGLFAVPRKPSMNGHGHGHRSG
jgi:hypothetical protein